MEIWETFNKMVRYKMIRDLAMAILKYTHEGVAL